MKSLSNFIKRNLPIFIIGLLTMLVFVGIIILSERNDPQEPALKIVNESELIAEHNYFKGPEDAKVVLVEFSDFQCPACALFQPLLQTFELKFPNLKFVYKHYPLPQHPQGKPAALASMAAGEQDAFWEYHDKLFENQNALSNDLYIQIAKDLGLDEEKFKKDMESEKIRQYVEADIKVGQSVGVNSTPSFYLNGRALELNEVSDLEKAIADEFKTVKIPTGSGKQETQLTDEELKERARKTAMIDYGDIFDKPTYDISLTPTGPDPYEAEVRIGQKVIWTNNTENTVTVLPDNSFSDIYPEFKNGLIIQPKGQGELEIYKEDSLMYFIKETGRSGYIYPKNIEVPLVPQSPESTPSQ
jgi:protein-disulfide isomerase